MILCFSRFFFACFYVFTFLFSCTWVCLGSGVSVFRFHSAVPCCCFWSSPLFPAFGSPVCPLRLWFHSPGFDSAMFFHFCAMFWALPFVECSALGGVFWSTLPPHFKIMREIVTVSGEGYGAIWFKLCSWLKGIRYTGCVYVLFLWPGWGWVLLLFPGGLFTCS